MRRQIFIPTSVKSAISQHFHSAIDLAVAGAASAIEDEDTLTGHLGARLQSLNNIVEVRGEDADGPWHWSLNYHKFRGRGPGATESFVGADGIFDIRYDYNGRIDQKSLLFQTKLGGAGGSRLIEQCARLSTWREASFVLDFNRNGFQAIALDEVFAARGTLKPGLGIPLAAYLGGPFLDCKVGDNELRYDRRKHLLIWRSMSGEMVAAKFIVRHTMNLTIQGPNPSVFSDVGLNQIEPHQIPNFRMHAAPDEILAFAGKPSKSGTASAPRALAKAYHPDLWTGLSPDVQDLMKMRMQEVNDAVDKKKKSTR